MIHNIVSPEIADYLQQFGFRDYCTWYYENSAGKRRITQDRDNGWRENDADEKIMDYNHGAPFLLDAVEWLKDNCSCIVNVTIGTNDAEYTVEVEYQGKSYTSKIKHIKKAYETGLQLACQKIEEFQLKLTPQ